MSHCGQIILGEPYAQWLTGAMYLNGQGTAANPLFAYIWISLAAEHKSDQAAELLPQLEYQLSQEDPDDIPDIFKMSILHQPLLINFFGSG